jgi:hypothetical protein
MEKDDDNIKQKAAQHTTLHNYYLQVQAQRQDIESSSSSSSSLISHSQDLMIIRLAVAFASHVSPVEQRSTKEVVKHKNQQQKHNKRKQGNNKNQTNLFTLSSFTFPFTLLLCEILIKVLRITVVLLLSS